MEVWRGPLNGEPGLGTFRSYITQVIQHALVQYPQVFVAALQSFLRGLPTIPLEALNVFFETPTSLSDPVAIVAKHYLRLLQVEEHSARRSMHSQRRTADADGGGGAAGSGIEQVVFPARGHGIDEGFVELTVPVLQELLQGFFRLLGPAMEQSQPRTALLAFLTLIALCDLRHQRRLCVESLTALLHLEGRSHDANQTRFWACVFFTLLEFSRTLSEAEVPGSARKVCFA